MQRNLQLPLIKLMQRNFPWSMIKCTLRWTCPVHSPPPPAPPQKNKNVFFNYVVTEED